MVTQDYARQQILAHYPVWLREARDGDERNHLQFWFWLRENHRHLCTFRCQGYPDRKMRRWVNKVLGSVFDV